LFVIIGYDIENEDQNDLSLFEWAQTFIEVLNQYFGVVCELDIMFNLEKCIMILDEMVSSGCIVETNHKNILRDIYLIDDQTDLGH